MDEATLAGIEQRAEAATPGPWELITPGNPIFFDEADAAFVSHAREGVPALVAEVRRLSAENDELRSEIGRLVDVAAGWGAVRHRLSAALAEQQRENERKADLIAEFRKRDESQDRIRKRLTAECDALQVDNSVQFDRAEKLSAVLAEQRANFAAMHEAHALTAKQKRAAESALADLRAKVEALCADVDRWTPYDSRDAGQTFLEESVRDLVDDLRTALAAAPSGEPR